MTTGIVIFLNALGMTALLCASLRVGRRMFRSFLRWRFERLLESEAPYRWEDWDDEVEPLGMSPTEVPPPIDAPLSNASHTHTIDRVDAHLAGAGIELSTLMDLMAMKTEALMMKAERLRNESISTGRIRNEAINPPPPVIERPAEYEGIYKMGSKDPVSVKKVSPDYEKKVCPACFGWGKGEHRPKATFQDPSSLPWMPPDDAEPCKKCEGHGHIIVKYVMNDFIIKSRMNDPF